MPLTGSLLGEHHQAAQAQATDTGQAIGAAWEDVTGATVTMTTGANPCLVLIWGMFIHNTVNGVVGMRLDYDSAQPIFSTVNHATTAPYPDQQQIHYLHTVTAGKHTWHVDAYGPTTTTLSGLQCYIQVIELK